MQKQNGSGKRSDLDQDHPLYQINNAFRSASEDKEIPSGLVAIGIDATHRAFFIGIIVGSFVLFSFVFGMVYLGTNPVYIATSATVGLLLIFAGIAYYNHWWMAYLYLIAINPFLSIVVMSVGYREIGGFFISALSIFVLVSYVYLPHWLHYLNLTILVVFVLFQYLGGPEALLGPADYTQSTLEKLVLTIVWLFAFLGTIRVTDWRNQTNLREVVNLNIELDQTKESLVEANEALDQANALLEERVVARTVALETALTRAQAANEAKDRFLATMSHELRTPLNAIIGYSELIPDIAEESCAEEDGGEIIQAASNITEAGRSLLALINDVLDISAIESGRISPDLQEIKLVPFINTLAMLVKPQVERNQNQLILENQFGDQTIVTDHKLLQQILINLMSNAAKFTKNGSIQLLIQQRLEGVLRFEVQDSGIGIPGDQLAIIFDPFAQVQDTYTRQYEGSGLGLAITKQLIEALGGTLGVSSKVGQGSRFWIDLPSKPVLTT
ncbi:MAG: ATP-binding protein [Chloroflexota bacterium]